MTAIKICGLTRAEDAQLAASLGATFVGFVLWAGSPRYVPLDRVREIVEALPPDVTAVGVFVNPTAQEVNEAAAAGVKLAQIHGQSSAWMGDLDPDVEVIRAVHLSTSDPDGIEPKTPNGRILLDAHDPVRHGGTGRTIDWTRARAIAQRRQLFLAGGLPPANVRQASREVMPFAVDV